MKDLYLNFAAWLDKSLEKGIPDDTAAVCFNLYEDFNKAHTWGAEICFSDKFDADDESGDWACGGILLDPMFFWDNDSDWESAQDRMEHLVKEYLDKGIFSIKLKALHGVGVGFAEGDLTVVYINNDSTAPIRSYAHYDPEKSEKLIKQKSDEIMDLILKRINDKK